MPLTTHHLTFTATVQTPLELDDQAGSALRGALVGALWERFCTNKAARQCVDCPLIQICPVAALIAPMREEGQPGGEQRPRPYVMRPPVSERPRRFAPGEAITFSLALFGETAQLFPYVVLAAQAIEQTGIGRPLAVNGGRRGQLRVETISACHPLSGGSQPLFTRSGRQVQAPGLPVTPEEVAAFAAQLPADQLLLRLLTPLRLIDERQLVRRFALRPLIQRLMRRLDELARVYGSGPLRLDFAAILGAAEAVCVVDDQTRWVDVVSYSSRQHSRTPIGGLVGPVTIAGDLTMLRELLVWGSLIHVGKNAVKGDGWYRIES